MKHSMGAKHAALGVAIVAGACGAVAVGSLAIGALAIGRLAIGRFLIGGARASSLYRSRNSRWREFTSPISPSPTRSNCPRSPR